MLRSFLAVGCGCFVGGILRYLLTLLLPGAADGRFPWSTFAANVLGCLLIGLLSGWLSRIAAPDALRLFLTVGLCGGFTTFSTFVADGRSLWQQQLTLTAVAYLCSSLVVGFALLWLGHRLTAGSSTDAHPPSAISPRFHSVVHQLAHRAPLHSHALP